MIDRGAHTDATGHETMSPEMANASNYYRWIMSRLAPHLGKRVLDIGGGYGTHLEPILTPDREVVSIDRAQDAVEGMRRRFADKPRFEAICAEFDSERAERDLREREFDTILCLNVLEHIADDASALRAMRAILQDRGGSVVLQVPAHPWLFGRLDSLAGHHRRYTAEGMGRLLAGAGFRNPSVRHFNRLGVLPWFINGRVLKPSRIDADEVGVQVKIFDKYLVPLARAVEVVLPLPIGQSLIAVAKSE